MKATLMVLVLLMSATACQGKPVEPAPAATATPTPAVAPAPTPTPALAPTPPAPEPPPAHAATSKPDPAPRPPPMPEAPDPEAPATKQCNAILEKAWAAVTPAAAKLGLATDEEAKADYLDDVNFLEACTELEQAKRDCLQQADNPIAAIDSCQANAPKRTLYPHDFGSRVVIGSFEKLSDADKAALAAWQEGTWVSEWPSAHQTTRWVIGPEGKVVSAEVKRDGKPDVRANVPERISFTTTRRMDVLWKDSTTTQNLAFFKESDDVFYASTNKLYDAYPVPDEKKFVVRHGWDFIVVDGDACEVITAHGVTLPAKCAFGKDGDRRVFTAEFTRPGASRPATTTHVIIGNQFLHSAMVDTARFVRQK